MDYHQLITIIGILTICCLAIIRAMSFYELPINGIVVYMLFYAFMLGMVFTTSAT
jgi:hypothetical protein